MVRSATWVCVILTLLIGATGCVKATGAITEAGYRNEDHAYRVAYGNPGSWEFIDASWQLENYRRKGKRWVQNTSEGWVAVREFDSNSDGEITFAEKDKEPIHDLLLTNVRDDGMIWVKVHPVHPRDAQRDLDSILNGYAHSLQGSAAFAQGSLFSLVRPAALKYTTFLKDVGPTTVSGLYGIIGTVETAEAVALQHNPAHRDARVRVVFARFARRVPKRGNGPWPVEVISGRSYWLKTSLIVVGYSNRADRFAEHLGAFDAFRQQITIEDAIALREAPVRSAPTAPAPAPVPVTPAELPAEPATTGDVPSSEVPGDPNSSPERPAAEASPVPPP